MASVDIEQIDQLLNELEHQALATETSSPLLFASLLQRLCVLLSADSAAILLPAGGTQIILAQQGSLPAQLIQEYESRLAELPGLAGAALSGRCDKGTWWGVPLRTGSFAKGCLLASFAHAPPASTATSICELLTAFAEIVALRQMGELERFLDLRWEKVQHLSALLGRIQLEGEAAQVLADQLQAILSAARVSVVAINRWHNTTLEAISGLPKFDRAADAVQDILKRARTCIQNRRAVLDPLAVASATPTSPPDRPNEANGLSVPLLGTDVPPSVHGALVIEWPDHGGMVQALTSLNQVLPTVSTAWEQQRRWRRIPRWIQRWSQWRWSSLTGIWPILRWLVLLVLAVAVYRGLVLPCPLTIEATGSVEPVIMRTVFASMDGYLEKLLVEDGQSVTHEQPLIQMSSPELEVRLEELQGEIRTLQERAKSIQIASNQLNAEAPDFLVTQNRMASELQQVTTQQTNLNSQLNILLDEQQKLVITAPIAGVVVAKDLKQQLTSRPVRRGDALFRIVDLQGPWHLRLQVPDRDSGYVLNQYRDATSAAADKVIDFVLDSQPEQLFHGQLTWISDSVQNLHSEGCFVEMRASVAEDVIERVRMGASARAVFTCEAKPLWFVWCRPLVEAIQRRLWFWR